MPDDDTDMFYTVFFPISQILNVILGPGVTILCLLQKPHNRQTSLQEAYLKAFIDVQIYLFLFNCMFRLFSNIAHYDGWNDGFTIHIKTFAYM